MRAVWILVVVLVVAAAGALLYVGGPGAAGAPAAGVPLALARERAARISNLAYDLAFVIPSDRSAPITARTTITFNSTGGGPLALDFAQPPDHVRSVSANGRAVRAVSRNGHLVLPSSAIAAGPNVVEIQFTAGDDSLNRNADYLYTLFVPARASLAMPCFDQPDLKARWSLELTMPDGWTAVANGRESARVSTGGHVTLKFDQTQPLSTYLFAFAAGRFSIETAERSGRVFRMFHRESDAAKVARNRDAIFDLHARALAWLEDYTGIPYPFGKFDFVLIPAFQFGGMEHPGAIYYNAASLMLDESATQNQRLSRANVISHETSHMWFGDLVTMKWFDDVWMKEVFANFMAAKIVNPSFPEVNHALRFLLQNYPAAYDVDRTAGANPIRQPLENLNEAGSLYGAIIYEKAPIVMRQLELLVGADTFRAGLAAYLKQFSFANAAWPDLIGLLSRADQASAHPSGIDLSAWSHAWVDVPGRPRIATSIATAQGRIEDLSFVQLPQSTGVTWPERLTVAIGNAAGVRNVDVTLASERTPVPALTGAEEPLWILPVGAGLGYGDFRLDTKTTEYLAQSLHDIADPLNRGAALVALWESMLEGRLLPVRMFRELLTALPRETDELNLAQMLDYARTAFWRLTPAEDRAAIAPTLERELREGLAQAKTTSARASWFMALRATATTPATITWLDAVWRRQISIEGLPFSESDDIELALELAVRGVLDSDSVLDTQLARITNPDRRARFQFLRPAVSRDQATRDQFFDSLKDVKNRAHEAWVLDALRYLNHPLRADESKKYIVPSLAMVREIQRTGDIFFPKRWADAALWGYQTPEAAAETKHFIDTLPPDYPERLRWILLSAADPLFRVGGR